MYINSSIVECWDGFPACFSTGIEPVIEEREGKKRENRRLTGANANMPRNYRLDADYENAGVGIVVKNNLLNAIKNVKQINGRMMSLTLASYGFDVTIITAYAPQSNYDTEKKIYDNLLDEIMSVHGRYLSVEISMPEYILSGKPIPTFVVPIF